MSSRRDFLTTMLPLAALVACQGGGGSTSAPTTTVAAGLTDEQAAAMANVLFDNYDAKGATFAAVAASTVTSDRIDLSGEIDWVNHRGHALVQATGPEMGVAEVFWQDAGVLERRPQLTALLTSLGRPVTNFVAREPDPVGRDLDRVLALVTGLASQRRDNPLLIQQTEGSQFLRTDTLREIAVQVLRYGQRNQSWLAVDDGRLLRFEGNNETGNRPVVIDIIHRAAREIAGPLTTDVATVEQLGEIYDAAVAVQPQPQDSSTT